MFETSYPLLTKSLSEIRHSFTLTLKEFSVSNRKPLTFVCLFVCLFLFFCFYCFRVFFCSFNLFVFCVCNCRFFLVWISVNFKIIARIYKANFHLFPEITLRYLNNIYTIYVITVFETLSWCTYYFHKIKTTPIQYAFSISFFDEVLRVNCCLWVFLSC